MIKIYQCEHFLIILQSCVYPLKVSNHDLSVWGYAILMHEKLLIGHHAQLALT